MSLKLLFVAGLVAAASAASADVTPLQKVVAMLNDMEAKGVKAKHEEEVSFAKDQQLCDEVRSERENAIKEGAEKIDSLTADINTYAANAKAREDEVAEREKQLGEDKSTLAAMTKVRDADKADFEAEEADLEESIDACGRAIGVLNTQSKDTPQSLLQIQNSVALTERVKVAVQSWVSMMQNMETGAPEANAYEFQSGGVVGMLEGLKAKFQDELLALQKEEQKEEREFQVVAQKLTDEITRNEDMIGRANADKAKNLENKAQAEADLEVTKTTKAEDEKVLSDTNAQCLAKSEEFEKNQVLRAEEIRAIREAVGILNSDAVKGSAEKHLPAASSLSQLRSSVRLEPDVRSALVAFLQGRAKELGSRYLALIASRAESDPFGKVKKMIKDLIVKLMEEANSEADSKAYCDTELATNKQTREIKQQEVEELTAEIELNTAEITTLGKDIAELTDKMAEANRILAEATKERQANKETNAAAVADAQAATAAVEKATAVLKDFYAKAADATLLQNNEKLSEEMDDAGKKLYKGMQAGSGGIIGFLEVVLSDFRRLETETQAEEDTQQRAFEKFKADTEESNAINQAEVDHKTTRKGKLETETSSLKKTLRQTEDELSAALDYYEKLKPDCVDTGLSYEDRVKAREAEIQSLKEALTILNQQALS